MKIFEKYVKTYDLKNKNLKLKYVHSYKVMKICKKIYKHENIDTNLDSLLIAGLFHDIGRFDQYKIYETYDDLKSIDHGDLGYNIFKEFEFKNIENYNEVLEAIKEHNKYEFNKNNEISKIVRDADKIDIFRIVIKLKNNIKEDEISDKVYNDFINKKNIRNVDTKTNVDKLILVLSMIYDLNYKYSIKFINKKYLKKYFKKLKENKNQSKINNIIKVLNEYIRGELC